MDKPIPSTCDPLESDGEYPTDRALEFIKDWRGDGVQLLELIRPIWKYSDCGYWDDDEIDDEFMAPAFRYLISTGGWGGNELLVGALHDNFVFWTLCWYSSRVGGHYEFRIQP